MRKLKKFLFAHLVFTALLANSACTSQLSLKTDPTGAKIYSLNQNGERGRLIGEAPFDLSDLMELQNDGYLSLEITKEGYDTRLFFSPVLSGAKQEFVVKLRPADKAFFETQFKKERSNILNASFAALLALQEAVVNKNDKRVAELSRSLEAEFSEVSLFHSLLGNYFYLQGNKQEALKRYERASALDPSNSEATTMLRLLKSQQKGSTK